MLAAVSRLQPSQGCFAASAEPFLHVIKMLHSVVLAVALVSA